MHVAITGASSGIGAALAREYHRAGATLTLVALPGAPLEAMGRELKDRVALVGHDLSDPDQAASWISGAEAHFGPLDVLVNNAGIETTGPVWSSAVEVGERVLAVNLRSPLRIVHALVPAMVRRGSGLIINVASVAGLVAPPGMAWYGASKAGIAHFSETLRGELRSTGVHVMTVYPGPIETPLAASMLQGYRSSSLASRLPMGKPEEIARRIRIWAEHRRPRLIYPRTYALTFHFARIFWWVVERIVPRWAPPVL